MPRWSDRRWRARVKKREAALKKDKVATKFLKRVPAMLVGNLFINKGMFVREEGKILLQAKASMPHGLFKLWVRANYPYSYVTATRRMKAAAPLTLPSKKVSPTETFPKARKSASDKSIKSARAVNRSQQGVK